MQGRAVNSQFSEQTAFKSNRLSNYIFNCNQSTEIVTLETDSSSILILNTFCSIIQSPSSPVNSYKLAVSCTEMYNFGGIMVQTRVLHCLFYAVC